MRPTTTGQELPNKIPIGWAVSCWWLSIASFGKPNRNPKTSRWLNTYSNVCSGVISRMQERREEQKWRLRSFPNQTSIHERKKSASYWNNVTWTSTLERTFLKTMSSKRHVVELTEKPCFGLTCSMGGALRKCYQHCWGQKMCNMVLSIIEAIRGWTRFWPVECFAVWLCNTIEGVVLL